MLVIHERDAATKHVFLVLDTNDYGCIAWPAELKTCDDTISWMWLSTDVHQATVLHPTEVDEYMVFDMQLTT